MSQPTNSISRRGMLTGAATGLAAAALVQPTATHAAGDQKMAFPAPSPNDKVASKGNINHSVCLWCYKGMKASDMAPVAKRLGLVAIDLLQPKDFPAVKEHGLVCSMTSGVAGGIENGFNRRENHDKIVASLKPLVDANAEHGFKNVICFSGNRRGQDDAEGIKICAEGIKKVIGYFEQKGQTLQMELLNSKVNHKDYQCDKSAWGIELCKAVGSENFKLLYDIYHMQIMEGDIMRTIKDHHQYFGHYHTGGNPGRNEINETQELYWPAIMKAIVDTKFKGYVAQEFIPKNKDMIASLAQAVAICDV
jgi:hydroxypyruvate isomerase